MEVNGMALAQTARMRERNLSSPLSPVTPATCGTLADPSAPATEEAKAPPPPAAESLDKYDISLIACTD